MANNLNAIPVQGTVNFEAWSLPIASLSGAEHTYVWGTDTTGGAVRQYGCFGRSAGPASTLRHTVPNGTFANASTLVCGDPADGRAVLADNTRTNINGFRRGDTCNILYGFHGVCHQMTNRILRHGGPMPIQPGLGNTYSYRVYGPMGREYYPAYSTMVNAILGAGAVRCGAETGLLAELLRIDSSDADETKKSAQRLDAYLFAAFGNALDPEKRNLLVEADQAFQDARAKLEAEVLEADVSAPATELRKKMNALIAEHFAREQDILGGDAFQKMYGEAYNKDLKLIMEADDPEADTLSNGQ